MSRCDRDARFRSGYLGPVGGAGSTVTPPPRNSGKHKTLEEEERAQVFYDAHFTVDVANWSRGIWLDGTMQIMDMEDILLSDRLVPVYLQEFPDDRCSANEALASMVGVAKIYDRILTLADEHGLHVDGDEFSTLTVLSGGSPIGTMMVGMRWNGALIILWMISLMILLLSILALPLRLLPGGGRRSRSHIQRDSTFTRSRWVK